MSGHDVIICAVVATMIDTSFHGNDSPNKTEFILVLDGGDDMFTDFSGSRRIRFAFLFVLRPGPGV